jgi:NAD(P)-dependent dehydrogenase (short-subunit alcohol dehydrogenase family)
VQSPPEEQEFSRDPASPSPSFHRRVFWDGCGNQTMSVPARVDILLKDAGYLGPVTVFESDDESDWNHIIQINLIGLISFT